MERAKDTAVCSADSASREILAFLRRLSDMPDVMSMMSAACRGIRNLVPAGSGVVLFTLDAGIPSSVVWPQLAGPDCDVFRFYYREIAPGMPFEAGAIRDPVVWRRSYDRHPAGMSVGIRLCDGYRQRSYLLALHRTAAELPFTRYEATILRILSALVSRLLTLRARSDELKRNRTAAPRIRE
jgi:hypothetical protein